MGQPDDAYPKIFFRSQVTIFHILSAFRLSTASCEQASSHRKLTEEDQEKFDQMSMDAFELTCKFASVCLVGRTPESIQTDLKERWADAGAELLVGAHTGEDEDEAAQVSPSFHIF